MIILLSVIAVAVILCLCAVVAGQVIAVSRPEELSTIDRFKVLVPPRDLEDQPAPTWTVRSAPDQHFGRPVRR